MNLTRRLTLALGTALALTAPAAFAQAFPSKPLRLVVNFPPGGAADVIGRALAQQLGEQLRQQVVVENRPGANGNIGADAVAKAAKDGHTLLLTDAASIAIAPALMPNLSYSPQRDLAPVSLVAFAPYILAVHPSVPATTPAELVAYGKANPAALNFAHSGVGSGPHLTGLVLGRQLGVNWEFVPFRGGAPAVQAVVQGVCQVVINGATATQAFVTSGQVRGLAVSGTTRLPALPQTPTFAELAMPQMLVESGTWQALFATAGTPAPVIAALHRAAAAALADPAIARRIGEIGGEVRTSEPDALGRWFAASTEAWGRVVRENNVTLE
jgi:tripartite-type tricarboxylate transporter receptor subunit TctC